MSASPSPVAISKNAAADDSPGGQLTTVDSRRLAGRGRVSTSALPQDGGLAGSESTDPSRSSVRMRNRKNAEEDSPLRPRSLDEILCNAAAGGGAALTAGEGVAGGSEDRRLRKSAEVEKNDLFNYLLHSEDTLGDFDRLGSIRKSSRRRPKTPMQQEPEAIGGSRERPVPSPSPVTIQSHTAAAAAQLEPNHRSWRTNVEKSSPLLETDLIRTPLKHCGASNQMEMNTRRSVSHDASENARDNARARDLNNRRSGDAKRDSSNQIIEICGEITTTEIPKYTSVEPTSSTDLGGNRHRQTKRELKDLDYLINDLEQTGREIERNLTSDSSVALSALRGEGDGAPQRPKAKEILEDSGGRSDSNRSKAAPLDDLKRRIANYKSHDASNKSSVSEAKSKSRSKTSETQGPAKQDHAGVIDHLTVTVADEGVASSERPDSSPVTKRWGRVFEANSTDTQQDVNSHQDHQEDSAAAGAGVGAVNDGSVDGMMLANSDYLRNERKGRSFEVDTSGVKLRGSGTSIAQATSSFSDNATSTSMVRGGGHLATGSLSSADDEGYTTMSNRSSSQTASIASFEEKLVDSDNKMLPLWSQVQDAHPAEMSPGNVGHKDAVLPSSAPINGDNQGRAGGSEEPEESKTGTSLFARSIDSLVSKGELVPSGSTIDIDGPEETAPSTSGVGSSSSDLCLVDIDAENSEQVVSETSQPRKFTMTREIRVPQQPVRSRPSSQTRSSVSAKPQKPSISDVTDRLSRPKKQTTTTTPAKPSTSVSSSSVLSPPLPKNSSSGRPDSFVRASPGRMTMPASVFNANKKKAAAAGDHLDIAPVPPLRTTSIRASAASDRLSKGLPTAASSHSRRSADPSLLAAAPASSAARKSPNIHTGHPSVTGATDGCADEGSAALSKSDKHRSSFIRKIVQKNPIRKAAAAKEEPLSGGIQRPSKPGMSGSSRQSKC